MSGTYGDYALDATLEAEGAWVEFRGGMQLRVRSDSTRAVRQWANKNAKGQRQQIIAHGGILPVDMIDKNEIAMCAAVLVSDWRGVTDRDGKPLPYSPENVRQVLTDLPSLRREVLFTARSEETFRPEADELGKTSAPPSGPSSILAGGPAS